MTYEDITQGTDEWFRIRAGKVTASKIDAVMAKGRSGAPSATRATYMGELVAERLTGVCEEGFKSAAMQHGNDTEAEARAQYTMRTGRMTTQIAFVDHPSGLKAGASPDSLVGDDGLLEIKCPNTATHIKTLRGADIGRPYRLQMQWQMICTERRWCDFVSYDPRLPSDLSFKLIRVERDATLCAEITAEVRKFIAELDAMEADLRKMMEAAA